MTDTAELEDTLTRALTDLQQAWPHMLTPSGGGGVAKAPVGRVTMAADDADTDADTPRLERVLSLRRQVVDYLAGVAGVIAAEKPAQAMIRCTHGRTLAGPVVLAWPMVGPRPNPGTVCAAGRPFVDTAGLHAVSWRAFEDLAAFITTNLRWFTGHRLAPTVSDALTAAARKAVALTGPTVGGDRDTLVTRTVRVGECPVVIGAGTDAVVCGTSIRVRLGDPAVVRCKGCGTEDSVDGWLVRIAGQPSLVTADQLAAMLHRRLGIRITRVGIRSWVHREFITAAACDPGTRSDLFDFGAVAFAIRHRDEARAGLVDIELN